MFKGTIPGGFGIIWKTTTGQLLTFQMIGQALTTDALA